MSLWGTKTLLKSLFLWFLQIYFATEEYGLDSTITCRGFFLLAEVFVKQGKTLIAQSLHSEVGLFSQNTL